MKALKEKRLGLRSFLRGGLVILSILALALAAASCADSGGDDTPTDGTSGTNGTTQTDPPPQVLSIRITTQVKDKTWSYQGCPPDITGVKIEVMWDNSPKLETIDAADFGTRGFGAVPNYCNIPGGKGQVGDFYITHSSGTRSSNKLEIPGVIALQSAKPNDYKPDVYSDRRPNFANIGSNASKLTFTGTYVYTTDNPTATTPALATGTDYDKQRVETKEIPILTAYPPFSLKDVQTKKEITAYIGTKGPTSSADPADFVTDVNKVEIKVPVNYYQVKGIKFKGADDAAWYAFDDQIKYYFSESSPSADKKSTWSGKEWLDNLVKAAKVTFTVWYEDEGDASTRDIDYTEFVDNVKYAYKLQGFSTDDDGFTADKIFYASDGKITSTVKNSPTETPEVYILDWNDDDGDAIWKFAMEYVPKEYIDSQNAYTARFTLELPVYTFANEISVKRAAKTDNNVWVAFKSSDAAMDHDLWKALSDRWVLTATYRRGRSEPKYQDIGITSEMFQYGNMARGGDNATASTVIVLKETTLSNRIKGVVSPAIPASSVTWERDWALPLRYRGEIDTDTVVVDLFYDNR